MAGVYGDINSRQDFFDTLARAKAKAYQLLNAHPNDNTYEAIFMQLFSIEKWTANGRTPTDDERESLDMSIRAIREFEPITDKDLYDFVQDIQALHNYVEDWPSDDQAASATDDDWFDSDD